MPINPENMNYEAQQPAEGARAEVTIKEVEAKRGNEYPADFKAKLEQSNPKLFNALVAINKATHGESKQEDPVELLASAQRGLDKALANYEQRGAAKPAEASKPVELSAADQLKERMDSAKFKGEIVKMFGLDPEKVSNFSDGKDYQGNRVAADFNYDGANLVANVLDSGKGILFFKNAEGKTLASVRNGEDFSRELLAAKAASAREGAGSLADISSALDGAGLVGTKEQAAEKSEKAEEKAAVEAIKNKYGLTGEVGTISGLRDHDTGALQRVYFEYRGAAIIGTPNGDRVTINYPENSAAPQDILAGAKLTVDTAIDNYEKVLAQKQKSDEKSAEVAKAEKVEAVKQKSELLQVLPGKIDDILGTDGVATAEGAKKDAQS